MKNNNKHIVRFTGILSLVLSFTFGLTGIQTASAAGPATIDLLSIITNDFVVLAQSMITDGNPTITSVTGNVGLSPAAGSNIASLSCTEVTGNIYDVDGTYTGGHDSNVSCLLAGPGANKTLVDNAVLDMGTAYVDGNTRTAATGAELNIGGGTLNGQNFAPNLYTWTSNVNITGDITLTGTSSDVWIFQVSGTLDLAAGQEIILAGGAISSNVFWVVTGATTIFPTSTFRGNILDQTSIAMQAGSILEGRALAQTAVTLIGSVLTSVTVDMTSPVITLNGVTSDITIGGIYTELGATATDDIDAPFAATPSGAVNTAAIGSYIITYNATDSSGNAAVAITRTVNVIAEVPGGGGGTGTTSGGGGTHYGCKDINATNYEYFAASRPSLCKYATTNTTTTVVSPVVTPSIFVPYFPNTGFAPVKSGTESNILNVFKDLCNLRFFK